MTDVAKKRSAPTVVIAIAAIALIVAWWWTRSDTAPVKPASAPARTSGSPAASAQTSPPAAPAATLNAYRALAPDTHATERLITPRPADTGNGPQAIGVVIDAPLQALHGSTFEVTVAAVRAENIQSAKFELAYDTNALEVLDSIDANGTSLPIMPSGDGTVELQFDRALGAARWPAVRFLVRVTEPRSIQLSVVAEIRDAAGNVLPVEASSPMSIMLWP